MHLKPIKGITNLGQWVSWDPGKQTMEVHQGGTWLIENGTFQEHVAKHYTADGFLDAEQKLLTPGLIDSHTHPAFATTREDEFVLRAQGKSYQEIAAAGGGIRQSVRALREISQSDLSNLIKDRLRLMLEHGTTTLECKSGYGLETEAEIKSLRAIKAAAAQLPIRTFSTFLGAHEIPDEYREDRTAYVDLLVKEMIPRVVQEDLADFCDVFCEAGVFTPEETELILSAAKEQGMGLRFHADEFVSIGGAELAVKLNALSADHLMAISDQGIKDMAGSHTVATLLPGTTFFLGSNTWAPARKLIDAGVTVALASDFNPGSNMSFSLPFVMTLAVIYLKMTPLEALQGVTYSSAKSLGAEAHLGAIYPGFSADAVVWDLENHRQLPYFYGINRAKQIIVNGSLISPLA
ncbi:MAG: imidazolonepropionase [Candidatus Marinimicrobia bacterium]|nr:imidazolonepropionase [Candidatus Neomarinimicrobiota bacterium]MCF7851475.1 imidazolonepropionase [Candidatus Neomarinimicrobiota bacterium]MCF7904734.1 imidazolonepropionase [Candidatus Neomarinimicrobiota bacterium]